MHQEALEFLEFSRLLEIIGGLTQSAGGRAYLGELVPTSDQIEVATRQSRIREVLRLRKQGQSVSLLLDGEPALLFDELRREGRGLKPEDFLLLGGYLRAGETVLSLLRSSSCETLKRSWLQLPHLNHLLQALTRTFDDNGEVRDEAHPELAQTRRRKRKVRQQVQRHLEKLLVKHQKALIPGAFVTQRSHRFVIPARVEQQRAVAGVLHGASASGATVFIEPFSAVELNNERLYCDDLEKEIIHRILSQLSQMFHQDLPALQQMIRLLGEFDALQALSRYAEQHDGVLAEFSEDGRLVLLEARHPLLLESLGHASVIPLDVTLPAGSRVLIISGPNTGGKTVALKTVGLFALAAHAAIPVPAREAVFPPLRQVQADIGDHQSIAENLSTFSAHMLRIKCILRDLETPALVLLDEIGSGTDPIYGGALGVSIVDALRRAGAILVATTHLRAVKGFASDQSDVLNASVGLDPTSLRPTYRLTIGSSGESSALEIASQLGLPGELITSARALLSEQEKLQERFLEELRAEKQGLLDERLNLSELQAEVRRERVARQKEIEQERARLETQVEQRLKEAEDSYKRDVSRFLKSAGDRITAVRLREQAARRRQALKEQARERIHQPESSGDQIEASSWSEGEEVFHRLFRKRGKIIGLKGEAAVVEIEGKRVSSPLAHLTRIEQREVTRRPNKQVVFHVVEDTEPELNLVGRRVDEAMDLLDKFLDRAFLSKLAEVRIIHGHGTGRLKKAVLEMLRQHYHVERSQLEGGATIAFLKD